LETLRIKGWAAPDEAGIQSGGFTHLTPEKRRKSVSAV
jgi:hypothetical protein